MARRFQEYTGRFFWDFVRMDNVNYNFKTLEDLYLYKQSSKSILINKVIIMVTASIIECIMFDFIKRINQRSSDPLPNLAKQTIATIKGKQLDQFELLIIHFKKQDLFKTGNDRIYTELERLRLLRNRIHIQNAKGVPPKKEESSYPNSMVAVSQNLLVKVVDVMCNVYPRGVPTPIPMSDFPTPWV